MANLDLAKLGTDVSETARIAQDLAAAALEEITGITLESPQAYEAAALRARDVQAQIKALDETRKAKTRPLDQLKKEWIEDFRPAIESRQRELQILKAALADYDHKARLAMQAAQAEAQIMIAAGESPRAALAPAAALAVSAAGVTHSVRWTFEVVDLSLVPLKYLVINEGLVGELVRAQKESFAIPGLKAVPISSVRVTRSDDDGPEL